MKTYKECCLDILSSGKAYTIAQIIKQLPPEKASRVHRGVSATISGILRKLVFAGELEYADYEVKGPRGGHTYRKRRK